MLGVVIAPTVPSSPSDRAARRPRHRRGDGLARAAALAVALATAAGCGGGDCTGFVSVNASPAECERLARQSGCNAFDASGPSCGLSGCATCDGLDPTAADAAAGGATPLRAMPGTPSAPAPSSPR